MVILVFLLLWAVVAALYDWRQRRLPNFLTLGALGAGAVYALIYGAPLGGPWVWNYAAAAVGLVVLLPIYAIGVMGAGDVKFFAAMGMLGGPTVLLPTLLVASLVVGGHAFLTLVLRAPPPFISPTACAAFCACPRSDPSAACPLAWAWRLVSSPRC